MSMPIEISFNNLPSSIDFITSPNQKRQLDASFRPGPYTVICARGRRAFNHEGNQRFRALAKLHQKTYASATCKYQKSKIVSHIVNTVRHLSPQGGFVKQIKGVYYEIGDRQAKEKVGQTFRDLLHEIYPSSTKAKARARIQQQIVEYQTETFVSASACSTQLLSADSQKSYDSSDSSQSTRSQESTEGKFLPCCTMVKEFNWASTIDTTTTEQPERNHKRYSLTMTFSEKRCSVTGASVCGKRCSLLTAALFDIDAVNTFDEEDVPETLTFSTIDTEPLSLDDDSIGSIDFNDTDDLSCCEEFGVAFADDLNHFCEKMNFAW
ncbi:Nitrilase family, member 2 [Seminavis robusta]|uniref:Nitrilase family, member 2 n=1 Tax=Seminavis robusta TaxID=568900 RepID=A0A9N8DB44_9STRA|nr:Nitrilase family, member 2 [Seminavis robusta]|eukprot:Sro68_g038050.1 Nitrilase family, member 2 (323) ;mRNA; f:48161-49129